MAIITPAASDWNAFVRTHPRGHFLQLSTWGDLKTDFGWTAAQVALTNGASITAGAQLLFRPLPLKLGTMAYMGYGGYVSDDGQWPDLLAAVDALAQQHGAAFLKWEPGFDFAHDPAGWDFRESPQRIQPPRTVMIDITGDDDTIQGRMNQSTRRNIRKAYRNDIHYYHAAHDDLPRFTQMMEVTGERNDFGVHSPAYYQRMIDLLVPDDATLILAEHEGDLLAANLVTDVGQTAVYLEGASSNKKRKLMASYGVQWEAIKWAQQRGCTTYDMWGVPDENEATLEEQFKERSDGLWGVYRFKRGWGGDVKRAAGAWDRVYNQLIYTAYRAALTVKQA